MRKLGLSLASLTLVALLALLAGSASAYVLLSPNRTWDCAPDYIVDNRAGGVPSILDADGGRTKVINAITSNGDAWNSESSGTVIKAHAGSVAGFALGDSVPMLNFTDPLSACTGTCLAATFTGYYAERAAGSGSWRITDADIVTNSTGYNWTSQGEDPGGAGCSSEIYIEGVMVHEIGHGLGLGHSAVMGATMFASVAYCNNNPATTEADDAAGLNALYGSGFGSAYDTYTNYLTGTGTTQYQPCGTYYWSNAGWNYGRLRGPGGTDFDLYLWRWNGSSWVQVASATGVSSSEDINYNNPSGAWLLWGAYSYSGSGTYHFYLDRP